MGPPCSAQEGRGLELLPTEWGSCPPSDLCSHPGDRLLCRATPRRPVPLLAGFCCSAFCRLTPQQRGQVQPPSLCEALSPIAVRLPCQLPFKCQFLPVLNSCSAASAVQVSYFLDGFQLKHIPSLFQKLSSCSSSGPVVSMGSAGSRLRLQGGAPRLRRCWAPSPILTGPAVCRQIKGCDLCAPLLLMRHWGLSLGSRCAAGWLLQTHCPLV